MVLNTIDPKPISDGDESTIDPTTTPPETIAADPLNDYDVFSSAKPSFSLVPWPGSSFIIRSVESGHVITLLNGHVRLTQPGGHGCVRWECVETEGWLGFRNTVSGKYLGYDAKGRLRCSAEQHKKWEYFCARARPEGGCILLMTHWEKLWRVGIMVEQGVEKLAKIEGSDGMMWEFAKVF
ncbi:MAG: hypothetical protein M1835_001738 [Candelina submexicana]|nr:MAG: hypothetical protein M1835_001738 [Candelina submexicana]